MKLTRKEITILRVLAAAGPSSLGSLALKAGMDAASASRLAHALFAAGFVEIFRAGKGKEVKIAERKHAQLLKDLMLSKPHANFEHFLSGPAIPVMLSLLDAPAKARDIAKKAALTPQTTWSALRRLGEIGFVSSRKRYYKLNERESLLLEFLRELQLFSVLSKARAFSQAALVLWHKGGEFLFRVQAPLKSKEAVLSGVNILHKYGVPLLLSDIFYYFYSPKRKRLRVEDAILHVLVEDPRSARSTLYALLAWAKNRIAMGYILRESERYGLRAKISGMAEYLRTKGKTLPEFFPSWSEFSEKLEEYK